MNKIIFFLLLTTVLTARDNPFLPIDQSSELTFTNNRVENLPSFVSAEASLPDTARVLKKVTLSYQNSDGSIEQKVLEINKSVDWHNLIVVKVDDAKSTVKSADSSLKERENSSQKSSIREAVAARESSDSGAFDLVAVEGTPNPYIRFFLKNKQMRIVTEDKMMRNFILINPHRIVIDFANKLKFLSKKHEINRAPFNMLRMGNHSGYYRVVVELDGQYKYGLETTQKGYLISLR